MVVGLEGIKEAVRLTTLSVAKHPAQNRITPNTMLQLGGCDRKCLNLTNVECVQLVEWVVRSCAQWQPG